MLVLCGVLVAETPPFRELTIDSSMGIAGYSNRGMAGVSLQLHDVTNTLYWRAEQRVTGRFPQLGYVLRAFMTGLIVKKYHLGSLYDLAYHELGHGLRAEALGYRPVSYEVELEDGRDIDAGSTYYDLLATLLNYSGSYVGAYTFYPPPANSHVSVVTGGVNNEIYMAERVENRFYERGLTSVYDIIPYLGNKLGIDAYASSDKKSVSSDGDMYKIQAHYKEAFDLDISFSEFQRYNAYALYASASFWAFLDGWSRYVMTGIDYVGAREFKGVRVPDVNFYLSSKGPSYRVQTGYRYSNTMHVPIAYERVFLGDYQDELSVGLACQWNARYATQTELRFGKALGATQSVRRLFFGKIWGVLGLEYTRFDNLYGERNISVVTKGHHALETWFALRFEG